jgi:hypothetical protein
LATPTPRLRTANAARITFTVTPREFRMTVHLRPSSDVMPDGAAIKEASKLLDRNSDQGDYAAILK